MTALVTSLTAAADADVVSWMADPAASSERSRCEFDGDRSRKSQGDAGCVSLREVAIDDGRSALRSCSVEAIATSPRQPDDAIPVDGRLEACARRRHGTCCNSPDAQPVPKLLLVASGVPS